MPKSYVGFGNLLDDIEAPGETEVIFFDEAIEEKKVQTSIEAAHGYYHWFYSGVEKWRKMP